ncbi:Serine/threonine-protein kinase dclk3 [Cichlidogyrus casuarinus]|uniref:Serine/threonine-protein kinase dclk3 n=1 Tax=Cichlidogyrus casuarinus TaxID=1844966 RepID=A0ABD2QA10_9PLAT
MRVKAKLEQQVSIKRSDVQTLGQVLSDISECFGPQWRHNRLRSLFHLSGKEVRSLSELIARPFCVFIGLDQGPSKYGEPSKTNFTGSDIKAVIEEHWPTLCPDPEVIARQWDRRHESNEEDPALANATCTPRHFSRKDKPALQSQNKSHMYRKNRCTDEQDNQHDSGFDESTSAGNSHEFEVVPQITQTEPLPRKNRYLKSPKFLTRRKSVIIENNPNNSGRLPQIIQPSNAIQTPFSTLKKEESARMALQRTKQSMEALQAAENLSSQPRRRLIAHDRRHKVTSLLEPIPQNVLERTPIFKRVQSGQQSLQQTPIQPPMNLLPKPVEEVVEEVPKHELHKNNECFEVLSVKQVHVVKITVEKVELKAEEKNVDLEDPAELVAEQKLLKEPVTVTQAPVPEPEPVKKVLIKDTSIDANPVATESSAILEEYDLGKLLGDGNFALVKQAVRKADGHEFAIKMVDKAKLRGKLWMLENEIRIMRRCNHKNILRLHDEFETKTEVWLILDYIKVGALHFIAHTFLLTGIHVPTWHLHKNCRISISYKRFCDK